MSRKVLLFAPCAFNLAETSRMVEIAKGVETSPEARARSSTSTSSPTAASSNS